jgi:hypothetical protein
MNREPRPPASLADVKAEVENLCRDIGRLQGEVNRLSNLIGKFSKGRQLRPYDVRRFDASVGETSKTYKPKNNTDRVLFDMRSIDDIEGLSRILKALARDLDGALLDVRAARLDVEAMAGSGELRAEFRRWKPS